MDKTIVLREARHANAAVMMINANWEAMAKDGRFMAVYLVEHKEKRSNEQQGLMWIRLGEIAEQAWLEGRRYDDKVWHEYFKEQFLPEEDGPSKSARNGYKKWEYLPNGKRVCVGSTTQLTTSGMADYQTQIEAYGASLGVQFSANPREQYR